MNYNETEMSSQKEGDPVKTDLLSESVELIRSFALLEEDEDLMPVPQREIERSITIIEAVYAKLRLIPFFVVPTRSGGVGVEYRIGGAVAYYHLVHGIMDFSVIEGNRVLKKMFFANVDEAAELLGAI